MPHASTQPQPTQPPTHQDTRHPPYPTKPPTFPSEVSKQAARTTPAVCPATTVTIQNLGGWVDGRIGGRVGG